jgi:probable LLM family oxidoreductase
VTPPLEIGIYTFAEVGRHPVTGEATTAPERLRRLLEEAELADAVGLDVLGIGEHHRPDYAVSAPAVVLGAVAARTSRIRLTSAVTVLSSDDPVRVFQDFATLDGLSGGRAEIMAGRGSFIESFPLFGFDLDDYDSLFAENLDLLLQLRRDETVTWSGRHRAPLERRGVYPRPVQDPLPVWIAVGGTPGSVMRAAALGLPMALAIIGGMPERFGPLVELYREAGAQAGHPAESLRVSINSHGFVADTSDGAVAAFYPGHVEVMGRIGRERGWPPETPERFATSRGPRGALLVGDVNEVTDKILWEHEIFGMDRFLLQLAIGPTDHAAVLRAIELLGTRVAPAVRQAVAERQPDTVS